MKPVVMLTNLIRSVSQNCCLTGIDVMDEKDPLEKRRTWIFLGYVCVYFLILVFTTYKAASVNLSAIIHGVSGLGFYIQAAAVIFTMIYYRPQLRDWTSKIREFYAIQEVAATPPADSLIHERSVQFMCTLSNVYQYLFYATTTLFVVVPYAKHLLFGTYELPFPYKIPYLDEQKSPGYEMMTLYMVGQLVYMVPFLCGFQKLYIVMVPHHGNLVDLMLHKMEAEEAGENKSKPISGLIEQRLLRNHSNIENFFGFFTSTQIICSVFQGSLCLYMSLFQRWTLGYFLMVLSAGQLFITCCYGYYVELKGERLTVALFNSWLDYPPGDRRAFTLMIAMAQQRQQLRAGQGFFEVGFNMYLKVVSRVYSLSMMLHNV